MALAHWIKIILEQDDGEPLPDILTNAQTEQTSTENKMEDLITREEADDS